MEGRDIGCFRSMGGGIRGESSELTLGLRVVLSLGSVGVIGVGNEGETVGAVAAAGTDVGGVGEVHDGNGESTFTDVANAGNVTGVGCCFSWALKGVSAIVSPTSGAEAEASDGGCDGMNAGAATLSREDEPCVLLGAPCRGAARKLSVH